MFRALSVRLAKVTFLFSFFHRIANENGMKNKPSPTKHIPYGSAKVYIGVIASFVNVSELVSAKT